MSKIPTIFGEQTISFFVDGKPYQVDQSMSTYDEVKEELKSASPDVERLIALTRPALAIQNAVDAAEVKYGPDYLPKGTVSVTLNSVSYNGEEISGVLVDRILQLLKEGFDIMPMVRFLENLYTNPADFARDELYLWLETSNLPITEDGYFLAYKNVNGDFTSIHDGKTRNDVGTIVSMPRHKVDDDRNRTCSAGLHFCSASYLPHFSFGSNNVTVLLKINPADVVSIPSDYGNAKGRAWQYEVLSVVEFDPNNTPWAAVVDACGDELTDGDDYDEIDWDEVEFDDDEYEDEEEAEEALAELVSSVSDPLLKAQADRINSLGIIALRREASKAGYKGAWKGPRAPELKAYLISQL